MAENLNYYDSKEECERRLLQTVVLYDNEPCYIHSISQPLADGYVRLYISMLPRLGAAAARLIEEDDAESGGVTRKKINAKRFNNFRPFPLGFCNDFDEGETHCKYLTRIPIRRGKQGLHSESLTGVHYNDRGSRISFNRLIGRRSFYETVKNIYPTFDQALEAIMSKRQECSVAVSREFCLYKDPMGILYLHRIGERIGLLMGGSIYLTSASIQYREQIIECPNLPNEVRNY